MAAESVRYGMFSGLPILPFLCGENSVFKALEIASEHAVMGECGLPR